MVELVQVGYDSLCPTPDIEQFWHRSSRRIVPEHQDLDPLYRLGPRPSCYLQEDRLDVQLFSFCIASAKIHFLKNSLQFDTYSLHFPLKIWFQLHL